MKVQFVFLNDEDPAHADKPDLTLYMKTVPRDADMETEVAISDFVLDLLKHPAITEVYEPIDNTGGMRQ